MLRSVVSFDGSGSLSPLAPLAVTRDVQRPGDCAFTEVNAALAALTVSLTLVPLCVEPGAVANPHGKAAAAGVTAIVAGPL
jgi:hypothetical protein